MKKQNLFLISLKAITFFTVLLGIVYPLLVTLIGQAFFSEKANGSLITKNNRIIGSKLIGQNFESDKYFWGRPSAINNNPLPSGGSNLSPTDSRLKHDFETRIKKFSNKNRVNLTGIIPSDMMFTSASGVDPHITKRSALLQINRIALERNLDEITVTKLRTIIDSISCKTIWGLFGTEYINVLELNIRLDELAK